MENRRGVVTLAFLVEEIITLADRRSHGLADVRTGVYDWNL
jgi:hypothetical protein